MASLLVRARLWVTLLWLAAFGSLVPLALELPDRLTADSLIVGSESDRATRLMTRSFESGGAESVWLILTGVGDLSTEAGLGLLEGLHDDLQARPWVTEVQSYYNTRIDFFLGAGSGGGLIRVNVPPGQDYRALIPSLRATGTDLVARLAPDHPDVALEWTGAQLIGADLLSLSERDVRLSEARAVPVTAFLLAWAFGALIAMAFPLVVAALAIATVFGLTAVIAGWWQPSILLQNVVSLLGLALGIDYTLLMVSRFREELKSGLAPVEAAVQSLRRAGRAVLLSGSAVVLSFLALAIVPIDELRSIALGGLMVTIMTMALTTTLVPGWLAWLGPRINALRIPFLADRSESTGRIWRGWTGGVLRRPFLTLVLVGLPLLALVLPALDLKVVPLSRDWLPPELTSMRGLKAMEDLGRGNLIDRLPLVYRAPQGEPVLGATAWDTMKTVQARLAAEPRIDRVTSVPSVIDDDEIELDMLQMLAPTALEGSFLAEAEGLALFDIVPKAGLSQLELLELARDLRAGVGRDLPGEFLLTGFPAHNLDYQDTVEAWFPWVIALVLGTTFLALFLGFRSVLIPLKAVLLNLVSVGAAFGALQLVFVAGWGAGLIGLTAPVEGIFPAIPIIVFCVVFGISMDYEVFLLSRVAEARRRKLDEAECIVEGVAVSGHLITSAAAIMIAVFASVVFGDLLVVQMLGFTLAVAVLVDATIVRLVLGPALIRLAGRWNWWPGG